MTRNEWAFRVTGDRRPRPSPYPASSVVRNALAIRQSRFTVASDTPSASAISSRSRGALGHCMLRRDLASDAEPLLAAAHAVLSDALGAEHPHALEVASWLEEIRRGGRSG